MSRTGAECPVCGIPYGTAGYPCANPDARPAPTERIDMYEEIELQL